MEGFRKGRSNGEEKRGNGRVVMEREEKTSLFTGEEREGYAQSLKGTVTIHEKKTRKGEKERLEMS